MALERWNLAFLLAVIVLNTVVLVLYKLLRYILVHDPLFFENDIICQNLVVLVEAGVEGRGSVSTTSTVG